MSFFLVRSDVLRDILEDILSKIKQKIWLSAVMHPSLPVVFIYCKNKSVVDKAYQEQRHFTAHRNKYLFSFTLNIRPNMKPEEKRLSERPRLR
jgi:hypothetical protein